ncbi:atp4 subunit B of the stator stalk of mitochondrial F1F0 ATP synthase [Irineochytrium annulatum]|nr:atp4 subunit B of the stator stalk of mitochondrial F1F0 ATP synthase [Irineochytrium annulatum]
MSVRPVSGRSYSTEVTKTEQDPAAAASSLISLFPGSTPAAKAGSVLLFSSIAAWLISKEIYIVDGEFFELGCLFGAYYIWWSGGKEGAKEYFEDRQSTIRNVLNAAREEHKEVVRERMTHIAKLSDVVDVTKSLFGTAKDIAKLEAECYELKQRVAYTQEVKSVLDSWVRYETSVREREQRVLAESVIQKIRSQLMEPGMQNKILQQAVADVEKAVKA